MQMLLWTASFMAVVTFCVHAFVGGAYVARPLLADRSLPRISKWLNYYCWHVTTVTIAFVAAGFAASALVPQQQGLIVFLSALTGAASILSAAVAVKARIHPFRLPSTSLFALISIPGWLALWP